MSTLLPNLLFAVAAYLIGSISFAVVSSAMGLADPRSYGSGNPGATNVLRTGNKAAALLTLIGDAGKGFVAVLLAQSYGQQFGVTPEGIALVAFGAFAGHLFPVFHRFAGGKGVATALGILLALNPVLGFATLLTWLAVAAMLRYSSLAALVSALLAPLYWIVLVGYNPIALAIIAMSGLLIYRHRGNIAKLLAGTESRIGDKKKA